MAKKLKVIIKRVSSPDSEARVEAAYAMILDPIIEEMIALENKVSSKDISNPSLGE